MGLRHDIAQRLRDSMADVGVFTASKATVYDAGVDIVNVPAVVVNPGDPYLEVVTMRQGAVMAHLQLHLVTSRTTPSEALTFLEDFRKSVTDALAHPDQVPAIRWVAFGGFGTVEVNDNEYAAAVLEIATTETDRKGSA